MSHYETLGVDKGATADAIKKAYRKLASTHHPDKGGDTQKFQELQRAYDTLSDPGKRQQYDAEQAGGRQFHFRTDSGMDPEDLNDIFSHMSKQFGFGFRGDDPFAQFRQATQNRQSPRNRDIRISVQVSLLDTLEEQLKTITITLPGNMKETVELKIPRGVTTGSTIRFAGLGDHSVKGMPRADLYVQIHVTPDFNYEQSGIDLVTQTTINCLEAITGCEKDIKGIDGKIFKIVIPPGTQVGTKFGISEQGLYSTEHPGRGRLIVNLNIYIPKELSNDQLQIIKDIQSTL